MQRWSGAVASSLPHPPRLNTARHHRKYARVDHGIDPGSSSDLVRSRLIKVEMGTRRLLFSNGVGVAADPTGRNQRAATARDQARTTFYSARHALASVASPMTTCHHTGVVFAVDPAVFRVDRPESGLERLNSSALAHLAPAGPRGRTTLPTPRTRPPSWSTPSAGTLPRCLLCGSAATGQRVPVNRTGGLSLDHEIDHPTSGRRDDPPAAAAVRRRCRQTPGSPAGIRTPTGPPSDLNAGAKLG